LAFSEQYSASSQRCHQGHPPTTIGGRKEEEEEEEEEQQELSSRQPETKKTKKVKAGDKKVEKSINSSSSGSNSKTRPSPNKSKLGSLSAAAAAAVAAPLAVAVSVGSSRTGKWSELELSCLAAGHRKYGGVIGKYELMLSDPGIALLRFVVVAVDLSTDQLLTNVMMTLDHSSVDHLS